jgi:oligosaccharyltransferase complex subunit gamma
MFNHIRHVPYVVNNGPGGVSYIAGGFGAQFGLETQIIAVACMYLYPYKLTSEHLLTMKKDAILAFSTIALGLKVPRMTHPGRQTIAVWAWSTILLIVFSFLISIFKIKNGAYPFYLPPFRG